MASQPTLELLPPRERYGDGFVANTTSVTMRGRLVEVRQDFAYINERVVYRLEPKTMASNREGRVEVVAASHTRSYKEFRRGAGLICVAAISALVANIADSAIISAVAALALAGGFLFLSRWLERFESERREATA